MPCEREPSSEGRGTFPAKLNHLSQAEMASSWERYAVFTAKPFWQLHAEAGLKAGRCLCSAGWAGERGVPAPPSPRSPWDATIPWTGTAESAASARARDWGSPEGESVAPPLSYLLFPRNEITSVTSYITAFKEPDFSLRENVSSKMCLVPGCRGPSIHAKDERGTVLAKYHVLAAGFVLSQVWGTFRLVTVHPKLNGGKKWVSVSLQQQQSHKLFAEGTHDTSF